MTEKQKDARVKEMEKFVNEGVPEEAKDKECLWEENPSIKTYAIEVKQRVNKRDNKKKIEVKNYKAAMPRRSEDASIKTVEEDKEKSNTSKGEVKSR